MQPEDRIRLRHLREAATKAITYSGEGKQRSDLDDELHRGDPGGVACVMR
jgi:hypothetical protein